jgi:hypothetical protein
MCFARLVAILVIFIAPSAASAWNSRGHMMVTAVAWEQLEEPTQKRVVELLKLNPNYADWIKGVPKADQDKTAFMKASIWPDFLRDIAVKPEHAGGAPLVCQHDRIGH